MLEFQDGSSLPVSDRSSSSEPDSAKLPPPLPILERSKKVGEEPLSTGLNMYFKKLEPFSSDPDQGGGPLNLSNNKETGTLLGQQCITREGQKTLTDYVLSSIKSVMFCRYGLDYLTNFPVQDKYPIGSFNINLDTLIYQKKKLLQEDKAFIYRRASVVQRKTQKGQVFASTKGFNQMLLLPFYRDYCKGDVEFDSVFESGNLAVAMKVTDQEYDLILQSDISTMGHTQWFYFKTQTSFQTQTEVKFNILNLYKSKSLYQSGMKILSLDKSHRDPTWQRSGMNISYVPNQYLKEDGKSYYSLSFSFKFQPGDQQTFFAHSIPYTYSMLNKYLNQSSLKRQLLCRTLAGNKCEYLHITSSKRKAKEKQVVFLTSRVHPGEANASWMIKGLIDMLTTPQNKEEEEIAEQLKEEFQFYIVPMLNIDGVINGNYRCSLAACDLNRQWINPSKILHPTIHSTKQLCQQLGEKSNLFMYLDFHGHSIKENVFQYGNKTEMLSSRGISQSGYTPEMFPLLLSKNFDYFNYADCSFQMPKSKESTSRIEMFHHLKIPFVFTLEASFSGANQGQLAGQHFSIRDFENIGKYVLKAIHQTKRMENNKSLLKEVSYEVDAQSQVNEGGSSDDSSSEEEGRAGTNQQIKKSIQQMEGIIERDVGVISPQTKARKLLRRQSNHNSATSKKRRDTVTLKAQITINNKSQSPKKGQKIISIPRMSITKKQKQDKRDVKVTDQSQQKDNMLDLQRCQSVSMEQNNQDSLSNKQKVGGQKPKRERAVYQCPQPSCFQLNKQPLVATIKDNMHASVNNSKMSKPFQQTKSSFLQDKISHKSTSRNLNLPLAKPASQPIQDLVVPKQTLKDYPVNSSIAEISHQLYHSKKDRNQNILQTQPNVQPLNQQWHHNQQSQNNKALTVSQNNRHQAYHNFEVSGSQAVTWGNVSLKQRIPSQGGQQMFHLSKNYQTDLRDMMNTNQNQHVKSDLSTNGTQFPQISPYKHDRKWPVSKDKSSPNKTQNVTNHYSDYQQFLQGSQSAAQYLQSNRRNQSQQRKLQQHQESTIKYASEGRFSLSNSPEHPRGNNFLTQDYQQVQSKDYLKLLHWTLAFTRLRQKEKVYENTGLQYR